MQARVGEYERRLNDLKAATNAIPQIEAEYTQLTRDYEVNKSNYEKLLSRRESAQISGDMEANAGVIDFRIVDPPVVPPTPSWPNRPLLISVVLVVALGGGAGLAFLLAQLRPTIPDERRLRAVGQLAVFGSVALCMSDRQRRARKKNLMAFVGTLFALLSGYAGVLAVLLLFAAKA
jgi:hypothetical protein